MGIWLEDEVKDAVLAVRWKSAGDHIHPDYFVEAPPESFQLEGSAASFLARFIVDHVTSDQDKQQHDSTNKELDQYSLEVIASYLEDQGYTVSSPE
jgi:hypothetical protein